MLADKGYHGADDHVLTPYRGRNKLAVQKEANRAHAQLKSWQILRKLRCCPGASGSWPKPSMSFKPARSQDEKGSGSRAGGINVAATTASGSAACCVNQGVGEQRPISAAAFQIRPDLRGARPVPPGRGGHARPPGSGSSRDCLRPIRSPGVNFTSAKCSSRIHSRRNQPRLHPH